MCVSDHIGLQNRVGRSGFFFCNIFLLSEILDKFGLKNLILNFSQGGPIYIVFCIYDPQ